MAALICMMHACMQAQSEPDGVSSQKEARRLAFYLFWNVRGSYDRSAYCLHCTHNP